MRIADLDQIEAMASGRHAETVPKALDYLRKESLFQCARIPVEAMPNSRMPMRFIKKMIGDLVVRQVLKSEIKSLGICFPGIEVSKKRFRALLDTLGNNVLMEDAPKVSFSSLGFLKRLVFRYTFVITYDFKCYYFQFPLDQSIQGYFGFRTGNRYFVYTRAAMGCKVYVHTAQVVTEMLAEVGDRDVHSEVIIDNVMFTSDDVLQLQDMSKTFEQRCSLAQVTIGDKSAISTIAVHRGIVLDFQTKVIQIKPQWTTKFVERAVECGKQGATFAQWRSVAGMIGWATTVVEHSPGNLYNFLRFVARMAAAQKGVQPDTIYKMDASTSNEFFKFVRFIGSNPKVRPSIFKTSDEDPVMATDASHSSTYCGWGAVLFFPKSGRIKVACGTLDLRLHINILEVIAVGHGLTAFQQWIRNTGSLKTFVDNTTAYICLCKGISRSFQLNTEVNKVRRIADSIGVKLMMRWIRSAEMPADGLSRGTGFQLGDLELLLSLATHDLADAVANHEWVELAWV